VSPAKYTERDGDWIFHEHQSVALRSKGVRPEKWIAGRQVRETEEEAEDEEEDFLRRVPEPQPSSRTSE
jgi:hypothetical protein